LKKGSKFILGSNARVERKTRKEKSTYKRLKSRKLTQG